MNRRDFVIGAFGGALGDRVAYLQGITFANGTIEIDLKGKDVQQ